MIEDELLDTSNYSNNHQLYSNKIASVVGKIKDDSEDKIKNTEWLFLRQKCYSLKLANENGN